MRVIKVSRRAKAVTDLLKQAQKEGLIVQSPDGDEFIIAEIDDFHREIELVRQNKKLMRFLDKRGRQTRTFSLAEAKTQLGLNK
jgi:hypothetical protein